MKVAAIVLSLNEESRIEICLKQLRPNVDYIYVLDGGSSDKTVEIAKNYADKVEVKPFSGSFAEERNYAEDQIPIGYEWILHIDPDEEFPPDVLKNLRVMVGSVGPLVDAFRLPRIDLVTPEEAEYLNKSGPLGRSRLSASPHGLCKDYPDFQVRLIRRGRTIWKEKIHEVPCHPEKGVPIDIIGVIVTLEQYPIVHLARRTDDKRSWW